MRNNNDTDRTENNVEFFFVEHKTQKIKKQNLNFFTICKAAAQLEKSRAFLAAVFAKLIK